MLSIKKGGKIWECSNKSDAFLESGSIGVKKCVSWLFLARVWQILFCLVKKRENVLCSQCRRMRQKFPWLMCHMWLVNHSANYDIYAESWCLFQCSRPSGLKWNGLWNVVAWTWKMQWMMVVWDFVVCHLVVQKKKLHSSFQVCLNFLVCFLKTDYCSVTTPVIRLTPWYKIFQLKVMTNFSNISY